MLKQITDKIKKLSPFPFEHQEKQAETQLIDCTPDIVLTDDCTVNIYVHGYSAIMNYADKEKISAAIRLNNSSKSFLYMWSSGSVAKKFLSLDQAVDLALGFNNKALLTLKKTKELFDHFRENQLKAELLGQDTFFQELIKYKEAQGTSHFKINLIGHSLGARLICNALQKNRELTAQLRINNVILLGGAFPVKNNWLELVAMLDGNIYNFYSKKDFVLIFKPDSEKSIGRYGIVDISAPAHRIFNYPVSCLHWNYWNYISDFRSSTDNAF